MAGLFKKKEIAAYEPPDVPGLQYLVPDPFVDSPKVLGLDPRSYKPYVSYKKASLIMFYTPFNKDCINSAKHFAKTARKNKTNEHAFGAVDCNAHSPLCCQEGVQELPFYKLYAQGTPVATFYHSKHYLYDDMKKWLQGVPLTDPAHIPTRRGPPALPSRPVPRLPIASFSSDSSTESSYDFAPNKEDFVDIEYEVPVTVSRAHPDNVSTCTPGDGSCTGSYCEAAGTPSYPAPTPEQDSGIDTSRTEPQVLYKYIRHIPEGMETEIYFEEPGESEA